MQRQFTYTHSNNTRVKIADHRLMDLLRHRWWFSLMLDYYSLQLSIVGQVLRLEYGGRPLPLSTIRSVCSIQRHLMLWSLLIHSRMKSESLFRPHPHTERQTDRNRRRSRFRCRSGSRCSCARNTHRLSSFDVTDGLRFSFRSEGSCCHCSKRRVKFASSNLFAEGTRWGVKTE